MVEYMHSRNQIYFIIFLYWIQLRAVLHGIATQALIPDSEPEVDTEAVGSARETRFPKNDDWKRGGNIRF